MWFTGCKISKKKIFLFTGWYAIWKLVLSKFRLVQELLGQSNFQEQTTKHTASNSKTKKIRKD